MAEQKKKLWTLDEIFKIPTEMDYLSPHTPEGIIAIYRFRATTWGDRGTYLLRLFKRVADEEEVYEEADLNGIIETLADYLKDKIHAKRLLKDFFESGVSAATLMEVYTKITKEKPKVTVGVKKGLCYNLYVGSKKDKDYILLPIHRSS